MKDCSYVIALFVLGANIKSHKEMYLTHKLNEGFLDKSLNEIHVGISLNVFSKLSGFQLIIHIAYAYGMDHLK